MQVSYDQAKAAARKVRTQFYGQYWLRDVGVQFEKEKGHFVVIYKKPSATAPEFDLQQDGVEIVIKSEDPNIPAADCS